MQPDLPEPGRAGDEEVRHAREIGPDRVSGDVLAEPHGQRARRRRKVSVDVAEGDELRREVRHLDAHGLLAGDRSEDADLRGRECVAEVVLEPGDLRHLRPRRELQLVPRHARARDLAHDGRLDTELRERAHEEVCGLRARVRLRGGGRRRRAEQVAIRQSVLRVLGRRLEHRLDAVELRLEILGNERALLRANRRSDHVGIRLCPVEQTVLHDDRGRLRVVDVLRRLRLARRPLEGALRARSGALHHVAGAPEDRAGRGARHEQESAEQKCPTDDRRAGRPDERRERSADRHPDPASRVFAEQRHEAEEAHPHAEPERADLEQLAACEQQPSEGDEREREHVRGVAHHIRQDVGEPRANGATVEAEVEDRREDEPEREQRQAEELVLVLRALSPCPLLHARRDAWTKRPLLPPSSHEPTIRRNKAGSFDGLIRKTGTRESEFPSREDP